MDAAIEELKRNYARELPKRSEALASSVEAAITALSSGSPDQAPDWNAVEHQSHKLAGSSGTYGFLALSNVCRHLEDLVTDRKLQALQSADAVEHMKRWLAAFADQVALINRMHWKSAGKASDAVAGLEAHYDAVANRKNQVA